jgi:hypothetical protein
MFYNEVVKDSNGNHVMRFFYLFKLGQRDRSPGEQEVCHPCSSSGAAPVDRHGADAGLVLVVSHDRYR